MHIEARDQYQAFHSLTFYLKDLFMFSYRSVHMSACTCGGQKRVLDSQDMELLVVVSCLLWMLGLKLQSLQESKGFNC